MPARLIERRHGDHELSTDPGRVDVADVKWQPLATSDAHELGARFGFTRFTSPRDWMHRRVTT